MHPIGARVVKVRGALKSTIYQLIYHLKGGKFFGIFLTKYPSKEKQENGRSVRLYLLL